jgi:hypothetical protein
MHVVFAHDYAHVSVLDPGLAQLDAFALLEN